MELYEIAKQQILARDWHALRATIESVKNCREAEQILSPLLKKEFRDGWEDDSPLLGINETPNGLIEHALEKFAAADREDDHDAWTHSLSHFTEQLWERGMMEWIKRFNEQAFGHAEAGWLSRWSPYSQSRNSSYSCCDRLVTDILKHGCYNSEPAALGITVERMSNPELLEQWDHNPSHREYIVDRIKALPFSTKEEADVWDALWYLTDPTVRCRGWSNEAQAHVVNLAKVQEYINVLRKAGHDVAQYEIVAQNNWLGVNS